MPLAELNIAVPKFHLNDPRIADFMHNLERVNRLATRLPGFIWRFPEEAEGHPDYEHPPWSAQIFTMSVWERPEDLEHFVWNTLHKSFYDRKAEWFDVMESHHFVMWEVAEGHRPTLIEAKERLDHLDTHGDTDFAFGWAYLPHVKLWQTQQCG